MPIRQRGHARPRAVATNTPPRGRPRRAGSLRGLALRVLTTGLALAVLIAFAVGTFEQRVKEHQLREQVAAQQSTLDAARRRNDELHAQLAASDPDAYRAWVESTARRQLNLGYSGETIYLVNWTAAPQAPTPTANGTTSQPTPTPAADPNWRRWFRILGGG